LELIVIYEMEDDVTLSDLAHKFIPVLVSFAALRRPKSLSESMGSFMPVRPVFYNGALHPKVKRSSVKIGCHIRISILNWSCGEADCS
jgi:hypothetical protein